MSTLISLMSESLSEPSSAESVIWLTSCSRGHADQPTVQCGQRHDDGVILVAHAGLPLGGEHAYHFAGGFANADLGPDGFGSVKEIVHHGLADHAHRTPRACSRLP